MQTKSAAFFAALTAAVVEWRYGVDILAADEATPLENPLVLDGSANDRLVPGSGQVVLDVGTPTQRALALTLRNADGRYLVGAAGLPSGGDGSPAASGLTWINTRFRPWIDMLTGFDASGKKVYDRTYLGIYVLTDPEAQVRATSSYMVLSLLDKSALLTTPYLVTNATLPTFVSGGTTVGGYAAGSTFDSVMSDLATRFGVPASKLNFEASALTLPSDYSITEGSEPWAHLRALAAAMAHVLYFDSNGFLVRRADPLAINSSAVYTFAPGPTSIISSLDRKTGFASTYNHVIVIGGSSSTATFRGEAQVNDPGSPYHKNLIGDRVVYSGANGMGDMTPDPTIGSTAQANTKAAQILARHIGQQERVTIQARNMPLDPYDRIAANVPGAGLNMNFAIDRITWNLSNPSGGGMTLECSRWFAIGG